MTEIPKRIYQKMRFPFIKFCVDKGITPNMITVFNHVITLTFGCYFFSLGKYWAWLAGLLVMFINGFLDYLDGDLAKKTGKTGEVGEWLDSGFDVVIQNAVMGAIGIGCWNMGMDIIFPVCFLIMNSANNFVSFHYNQRFGFDSDKGNKVFRDLMGDDLFQKNLIDPTSSSIGLFFFTYRYWIVLGCIFNQMPLMYSAMLGIGIGKFNFMYVTYLMYLAGERDTLLLQTLSRLDSESEDFYEL